MDEKDGGWARAPPIQLHHDHLLVTTLAESSISLPTTLTMSTNGESPAPEAAGDSRDPSGFLSEIIGAPVTVKLNSGIIYKGAPSPSLCTYLFHISLTNPMQATFNPSMVT